MAFWDLRPRSGMLRTDEASPWSFILAPRPHPASPPQGSEIRETQMLIPDPLLPMGGTVGLRYSPLEHFSICKMGRICIYSSRLQDLVNIENTYELSECQALMTKERTSRFLQGRNTHNCPGLGSAHNSRGATEGPGEDHSFLLSPCFQSELTMEKSHSKDLLLRTHNHLEEIEGPFWNVW